MTLTSLARTDLFDANVARRRAKSARFVRMCAATAWIGVAALLVLIVQVAIQGASWLDFGFLTSYASRFPEQAGIKAAIVGTIWLISVTAVIAVPIGVATAVYLEEYASRSRLNRLIEVNIANLAGVPSIVYGILGLAVFVRFLHLDRSVIAGAMTMSLLILPVVITASREALRAVPDSLRHAAFGVGATRWQTVWHHVLPSALAGIMTGVILAISRAIGETAPLLMIGALSFAAFVPSGLHDQFTVLPIQIFNWAQRPQPEFYGLAAGAIIVLLVVLLLMNFTALWIRHRASRRS